MGRPFKLTYVVCFLLACIVTFEKNKGTDMGDGCENQALRVGILSQSQSTTTQFRLNSKLGGPLWFVIKLACLLKKEKWRLFVPFRQGGKIVTFLRQTQSLNLLEVVFGILGVSTPTSFIPSKIRYTCFCSFYCTTWTFWRSWCHMRSMITRCGAISKESLCGKFWGKIVVHFVNIE